MTSFRENLDAEKYRRSPEGKAEKKARKLHNERMGPTTPEGKKAVRKAKKKADAAKGASLRTTGFLPHEIKDNRKNK